MRGSPEFQAGNLARTLFRSGAKKIERINPEHQHHGKTGSYLTTETYKKTWINLFYFAKDYWKIKDCTQLNEDVIEDYLYDKIYSDKGISQQYLEKLSSAIGKLEIALTHFMRDECGKESHYDFSIRLKIVNDARRTDMVADNYHNRAYQNPQQLIDSLINPLHQIAAAMEYEGSARLAATTLIMPKQLHGYRIDLITGIEKGLIMSKEKGGISKEVMVSKKTYTQIEEYIEKNGKFKIDRQQYMTDIRKTCNALGVKPSGSHGLRWSFCRRRMMEYAKAGYTYEQSLQAVSWEMKHNRASITEHYLGS
ncbi:MAG: hypothetical protein Q8M39_05570 [Sulfuricurvum sp.]|nr:hypothetical protein [Sulfuricurvum sp.]